MYTRPPKEDDDIMSIEDFKQSVEAGFFSDYDGFGHPMKNGLIDLSIWIYPSELDKIPADANEIVWYNK